MITLSVTIPQLLGWSYPFIDLPVHTFYHTFYHTFWVQNEQNVTDIRKWLYEPNFRDMQPSTPIFAVVSHPKVVTEPVATLLIVFYYPTNARFNFPTSLARSS